MHPRLKKLSLFVGNELYSIYYRIACEICDCRGDLENAFRYLNRCKIIAKKIGMIDNDIIKMKIDEVKRLTKRKSKDKNTGEAHELMHIADLYLGDGKVSDALQNYSLALKHCKDKDPETEALCHFKIGRAMLQHNLGEAE